MFTLDVEFGCRKRNKNTDIQQKVNECKANAVKVI